MFITESIVGKLEVGQAADFLYSQRLNTMLDEKLEQIVLDSRK